MGIKLGQVLSISSQSFLLQSVVSEQVPEPEKIKALHVENNSWLQSERFEQYLAFLRTVEGGTPSVQHIMEQACGQAEAPGKVRGGV